MLFLSLYQFWEAINVTLSSLIFLVVGFIFVQRLGKIFPRRGSIKLTEMKHFGRLLLISISLHEFAEGVGLGSAFALSQTSGLIAAFLISIQNFFEGAITATPFLAENKFRRALRAVSLTQLAFGVSAI